MDQFSWGYLFIGGVILTISSVIVGISARRILKLEKITELFPLTTILVLGWMIPAMAYSIFKTAGNTSSVILFIYLLTFWIYLYFRQRSNLVSPQQSFWKLKGWRILVLTGVYILVMILSNLHGMDWEWGGIPYGTGDFEAYSQFVSHLKYFGVENTSLDWYSPEYHRNAPYHYLELWFSGFWSNVLNIPPSLQLTCLSVPYFVMTVVITAYETARRMIINKFGAMILSVLFPFIGVWGFLYPNIGILAMDVWDLSAFMYIKLLPIYPLFVVMIYLLYTGKRHVAVLFLLGLIGFSFNTLLPASGLVFIVLGLGLMYVGEFPRKNALPITFMFLATCVLWLMFYSFQDSEAVEASRIVSATDDINFFSLSFIQTAINVLGKGSIQMIIVLLPFALVWWYVYKKIAIENIKVFLGSTLILAFVPLIAWAVLHPMTDAVQLWGIFFMPAINVFIFLSLLAWFRLNRRLKWTAVAFVIVTIISHPFYRLNANSVDIRRIDKLDLPFNRPLRLGYLMEDRFFDNYFSTYKQVFTPASYLVSFANPLRITCLNPWLVMDNYDGPKRESVLQNLQLNSIMVFEKNHDLEDLPRDKLQLKFIEYYDLQGVIVNVSEIHQHTHLTNRFSEIFEINDQWVLYYTLE